MLENNRYRALMILIIVLVSVILLSSCGEPTFCELTSVSITAPSNTEFTISGTDDDLSLIEQGPGLILCYYIADYFDNIDNINTKMVSAFKSEVSPVLIINSTDGKITTVSNVPGTSQTDYSLYAFLNGASVPVSPVYSLNLSSYVSGQSINAQFTNGTVDTTAKTYEITDQSSTTYTFNFNSDVNLSTSNKKIVILAALTSGVGDFSNVYWSSLKQIGVYTIE